MIDLKDVVANADAQIVQSSSQKSSTGNCAERYTTPALIHEGNPLKHTVGSHFFKDNYQSAILIPIADTVNRAQLREQHGHLALTIPSQKLPKDDNTNKHHTNCGDMGGLTGNGNGNDDGQSVQIRGANTEAV